MGPLLGWNGAMNGAPQGGGLLNTASGYQFPLTSGLLGSLGSAPSGVPNYSQMALQMAGNPHAGPYAQLPPPSGVGVPGVGAALGSGAGGGSGGSTGSQILGGLLGIAARDPALVKQAGSLIGDAYGYLTGGPAAAAVGAAAPEIGAATTAAADQAASSLMPGIESQFASQIGADTAANLGGAAAGTAAGSGLADVGGAATDAALNADADAAFADAGANLGGAAGSSSALGTVGGVLGGAAIGGGLLYGLASLFDWLDPNVQMTNQQIAAAVPRQSPAALAAQYRNPMMTSNTPGLGIWAGYTPQQIAALGLS